MSLWMQQLLSKDGAACDGPSRSLCSLLQLVASHRTQLFRNIVHPNAYNNAGIKQWLAFAASDIISRKQRRTRLHAKPDIRLPSFPKQGGQVAWMAFSEMRTFSCNGIPGI